VCSIDSIIAFSSLAVSVIAVAISFYFWRLQFRPIVTAAIRTAKGGPDAIAYNLDILNSGSIPAKNILISVDETTLPGAFGTDATTENKARYLSCFSPASQISVLHNGSRVSCSFGTTKPDNHGFWKYRAKVEITLRYGGWFGKRYEQKQIIEVVDSDSFTGHMWGDSDRS
jgi:hypothetical protein